MSASPLRRAARLSAAALMALVLPLALPALTQAEDEVPASGYTPLAGESFFLLSDSSFATCSLCAMACISFIVHISSKNL